MDFSLDVIPGKSHVLNGLQKLLAANDAMGPIHLMTFVPVG
jgi:hypothetical protein